MIPEDILEEIIKAGTYAATGMGKAVTGYTGRYESGGAKEAV